MFHFLRTAAFLTALNLLAGNIPHLSPQLNRFGGFLMLTAWAMSHLSRFRNLYAPGKAEFLSYRILSILTASASFPLLLSESGPLLGISLSVFALMLPLRFGDPEKTCGAASASAEREIFICLLTVGCYTVFVLLYRFSDYIWYVLRYISLEYSAKAGALIHHQMALSANALGLPISISVFCYCISLFISVSGDAVFSPEHKLHSGRKRLMLFLLTVTGMIVMQTVWLRLQHPLTKLVVAVNPNWNPTAFAFQGILLMLQLTALCPAICLIFKSPCLAACRQEKISHFPLLTSHFPLLTYSLVFTAFLILSLHLFSFSDAEKSGKTEILFCDKGADWSVPHYGKGYGQHSTGMFGVLPYYLKKRGYETKTVNGALTEDMLKNTGIIAVFNPVRYFSEEEKQHIYKFIRNGGGLLVAGDHTDVTGVMKPINDLLEPFPLRLNFDTALPLISGWVGGFEKRPHPMTAAVEEDYETAIWVGASLKISPPAKPVIVGKLGWADTGNYLNVKRAYLGDYRRSGNEQLGDVVLAAETRYGKGKVLVFGDTSAFQNGALPGSYSFADSVFAWLSEGNNRGWGIDSPGLQLMSALLLLAGAAYFLSRQPLSALTAVLCILAAHLPMWAAEQSLNPRIPGFSPDIRHPKLAYISASHIERFSYFSPADNSLWGISVNLMRNGYIPLIMKDFSAQRLAESDLFISVAPTKSFSWDEIAVLKKFMEKGGKVIWSAGWEEAKASESFLKEFGFSVDAVPLGPAQVQVGHGYAKFVEAWPLINKKINKKTDKNKSGIILAEKSFKTGNQEQKFAIAVYQPVGKGGLVIIGDSEFLHSKNIESYEKHHITNIVFFKYLLDYRETR